MAETNLITISDVRNYRQVDEKFNAVRFGAFVTEVQRKNLRNLLGDALYLDFMNDARTSGKYADLLNGKEYTYDGQTIKYYGIKPALVYWWLALATREGDLFLSAVGAFNYSNNPQQNFESAKEKNSVAQSYQETAQGYANDIIKFLDTYSTTYPLWLSNSAEVNKSNFLSFRL